MQRIIKRKYIIVYIQIVFLMVTSFYFGLVYTSGKGFIKSKARHRISDILPTNTSCIVLSSDDELKDSVSIYDTWIKSACHKYHIEPALVKAVIHAESRFNPQAVSPKGAMGLMQLSPVTASSLGIDDPFNPRTNINAGTRYLKDLLDSFQGNKRLALAAYNSGPTRVSQYNGIPPFSETRKYLKKVLRYFSYYQKNMKGYKGPYS
jgi:soluble lytic murein transglycosylase-like protein